MPELICNSAPPLVFFKSKRKNPAMTGILPLVFSDCKDTTNFQTNKFLARNFRTPHTARYDNHKMKEYRNPQVETRYGVRSPHHHPPPYLYFRTKRRCIRAIPQDTKLFRLFLPILWQIIRIFVFTIPNCL